MDRADPADPLRSDVHGLALPLPQTGWLAATSGGTAFRRLTYAVTRAPSRAQNSELPVLNKMSFICRVAGLSLAAAVGLVRSRPSRVP